MNYVTHVEWRGDTALDYSRTYRMRVEGKHDLAGSADPAFRGDASKHNPEELFLLALSACHMLTLLAICARRGVRVTAYDDEACAVLRGGRLEEITLRPRVVADCDVRALHEAAHAECFIARTCGAAIRVEPR